ncbi:rho-associated protein kinase 2-like [Cyclopterus lumpus]|uniref:rho-associated protein kinase 2-like n=1 Tax=Cyclopterus lumpus TaxID=8103 RepID=UPI0014871476|nr:rho-associated protein kinase 2-like [Cyclopterus lumpus]
MSIADINDNLGNQVASPQQNSERPSEELDLKTALDQANEENQLLTKKLSDMEEFQKRSEIEKCKYCQHSENGRETNHLEKIQEVSEIRLKHLKWLQESESELARLLQHQVRLGNQERNKMVENYEAETRELSKSNRDLCKEKEDLSLRMKETRDQLIREKEELSLKLRETQNQLLRTTEELSLRLKKTQDQLLREKEEFSLRFKATQDQLIREKKDLALRLRETQDQASSEKEDLSLKLRETQDELFKEKKDLSLRLRETQDQLLRETKDLSLRLRTTQDELFKEKAERLQNVEALEAKINSLVDEAAKDQVLKQQELTNHQVNHQAEVEELENNLTLLNKINANLLLKCRGVNNGLKNQEEWQEKYDDLDKRHKMNLSQTVRAISKSQLETQKALDNKFKNELRTANRLNEKVQEMEVERTLLEDICLKSKKQLRGVFGPRMQDRDVELLKMKRKIQVTETGFFGKMFRRTPPEPGPIPYPFSRMRHLEGD